MPIVEEIQKSVYRIERIIKATLMFSKGVETNIVPFMWKELQIALESSVGYYSFTKDINFILKSKKLYLEGTFLFLFGHNIQIEITISLESRYH